jgi:hypothetical protein
MVGVGIREDDIDAASVHSLAPFRPLFIVVELSDHVFDDMGVLVVVILASILTVVKRPLTLNVVRRRALIPVLM